MIQTDEVLNNYSVFDTPKYFGCLFEFVQI